MTNHVTFKWPKWSIIGQNTLQIVWFPNVLWYFLRIWVFQYFAGFEMARVFLMVLVFRPPFVLLALYSVSLVGSVRPLSDSHYDSWNPMFLILTAVIVLRMMDASIIFVRRITNLSLIINISELEIIMATSRIFWSKSTFFQFIDQKMCYI